MWHVAVLLFGLLSAASNVSAQAYYSEGGPSPQQEAQSSLEKIVGQLQALREAEQAPIDEQQQVPFGLTEEGEYADNADTLRRLSQFLNPQQQYDEPSYDYQQQFQGLAQDNQPQEVSQELQPQPVEEEPVEAQKEEQLPVEEKQEKAPLTAQKKGQFEFVEFVEPHAKILKDGQILDKRAPAVEVQRPSGFFRIFGNSSNVVFIAVATVVCVGSVVGVVGGAYYFNTVRKQRAEAFDDFTRYSPAGPGRDMLRKGKGFAGSPVAESGDESLAYKAQLHHYQQTKQKIIGDEGLNDDHSDKSDDENDDLEEHNFSVYECPGLAPTGDIEVQNPNFSQNP
ncbi:unnamed protein product [Bursaphelenchus xylophilus]|uniref:(pine wood nematode) hypothetical protein n=1 Tax=Bursaphelenchus xylophilus TaxID=6326 RepID=A0A1I7RKQ2_BURXY|nr:unnamed protein product [Bursaphelenchus xylophilus]CAG9131164.1 unnamed protein product [Bursaphelenchus xylophilus]